MIIFFYIYIFSSPEPLGSIVSLYYRIGRPLSSVIMCICCQHFQTFSCETTGLIEAKSHLEPPWDGGMKVYSSGSGHMTAIYGKNLKKYSSLGPKGRWPWNLVCTIRCLSTTNFIQMMTLGWPWPILRQGQIWSLMLLYGKKLKQENYCSLRCQSR